ncbi:MAG: hypothetical protein ACRDJ4_05680 [Actinomycetota bacterium]
MAAIPELTRRSLHRRLSDRSRDRWPELADIRLRFRAGFAYVDGVLGESDILNLCRLRYLGSADAWGFAVYLYSKEGYEDSVLPTGSFTGTPEEALDCACGLYLNDPSAWNV